ncbi:tripartite tricarboxylate transporter substrate binding protein [Roseicella sp. DB1501]|uniref:Bug family tripartite tricarboxylate transporter substrate binding protein n=1 Tax=Roseicella sp. DB1501 TaxID=2730925 RepID=UPI0014927C55|nr:tripartite tricarboxylate transporter substrate binding protein [Roseicella sp. DB1501]NOG72264.1 tripartite tricarboxylate transporter substrate binding protein [Roseicella sp. DB1501]
MTAAWEPVPSRPGTRRLSRRAVLGAISTALMVPLVGRARPGHAQAGADWPSQSVRYINPFPPGGATDTLSRLWCARMTEIAGQQFVVENRSGSGGNVGVDAVAKSRPDGYTIGMGGIASHAIAPTLYASLPFDPVRDFTFVSGLWQLPNIAVINKDLPVRSVPELIALFKASPGKYAYGSSGMGTTPHLSGELLKQLAGVDILHVPYRGGAPALLDLMAGRVHLIMDNIPGYLPAVRDGKIRALAVTSPQRNPVVPDLPSMAEVVPGFQMTSWACVCGPAGMPRPAVERLSAYARQALESADLVRSYQDLGATPWWTTPEQLLDFRAREEARLAPLVRATGARVE